MAFLDVNPLSRGHVLVIPREPAATLDALSEHAAAELGRVLPRIARAVMAATGATAYNVLQNNGAEAHQAVFHVHFHIIPKYDDGSGLGIDWHAASSPDGPALVAAIAARRQDRARRDAGGAAMRARHHRQRLLDDARYLSQAAAGQLDLLARAKPIDKIIADPDTSLRVALLLGEIPEIKRYGASYGLTAVRNYTKYTILGRPAAVWFVGGADPVAFKPTQWCFPIVGCFAGLGWFDEDDALAFKRELEAKGLDVVERGASAYSTQGWFPDPVLSSMLGGGDDAFPYLANTILHESVHATVFVPDEQFFNESFAEYVADALTNQWVLARFGSGSPEDLAWHVGQADYLARAIRQSAAYKQLKAIYDSTRSRDDKLAEKAKIIDKLVADMKMLNRPNNATLTQLKLYNRGLDAHAAAHRASGDVRRLVLAGKQLKRSDFPAKALQEDLAPIAIVLADKCRAMPPTS